MSSNHRISMHGGAVALVVGVLALTGCAAQKPAPGSAEATPSAGGEAGSSHHRRVVLYSKQDEVDAPLPEGASVLVRASGPVSIVEGDLVTALVRAHLSAGTRERRSEAGVRAGLDDQGRFVIEAIWPDGKQPDEIAAFEVRLPRSARSVEVETKGAVTLSGLGCDAVVRTSNGAVTIADHRAGVHATTSNAQMSFERIAGVVKAETSNGIVLVREAHGPVSVKTTKAAIDLRLASDATGPVRATTDLGAIALRVGPSFTGTLTMRTSDAPIVVDMKAGAGEVVSRRIDQTVVRFGTGGQDSTIENTGGTIELKVMEQ